MLFLDRATMFSSQPLWLCLSSCQSQGGEFALTFRHGRVREVSFLSFIMPESGRWVFYRSSCQGVREVSWLWFSLCHSQGGELSTFHHAILREVSFYLSSCQSHGGEFSTFHHTRVREVSFLSFIMPESGEVSLLPFIMLESRRWVGSDFHHARVREVSWLCLSSCQSQGGELALRFIMPESERQTCSTFYQARIRKVSWFYLSSSESGK